MPLPPRPTFASKRKALQGQVLQQVELFDRLADPLLQITSRKGRIKWANRAAHDRFGETLIDRRLTQVLVSRPLKAALKELRKGQEAEVIIQPTNLPDREYRVRLVRLAEKSLYGARILAAITDVTEVLRLQAQRADFVANASHELKTPVAALSGFVETLQEDPGALPAFLPIMAKETARMRGLIQDLLELTRSEMEAADAPTAWLEVDPLIDQALSGLAFLIDQRGQSVRRVRLDQRVQVRADARALTTVFTNLLHNAATHGPEASEIAVETAVEGARLRVQVRNAGTGIAAKHLPRLTERFYRVDPGRSDGGTGLGLAIVKHILIRHEGQVLIHSAPGQGACFTVDLPLRRENAEESSSDGKF